MKTDESIYIFFFLLLSKEIINPNASYYYELNFNQYNSIFFFSRFVLFIFFEFYIKNFFLKKKSLYCAISKKDYLKMHSTKRTTEFTSEFSAKWLIRSVSMVFRNPKRVRCLAIHTTYISQFAATFNDARNREIHCSTSKICLINKQKAKIFNNFHKKYFVFIG